MSIISITTLNNGEVNDVKIKVDTKYNKKYMVRGQKMYTKTVIDLIKNLTKQEVIEVIGWHDDTSICGYNNILKIPFLKITSDMDKSSRSWFKRKLLDANIILEYNKLIMMNPYIFVPREDKNIENSAYLTQRVFKYLAEDKDVSDDNIESNVELIFDNMTTIKRK